MAETQQAPDATSQIGQIPLLFKDVGLVHIGTGTNTNPPNPPKWTTRRPAPPPNS